MAGQKKHAKKLLELGFTRKKLQADSWYVKSWKLPEKTLYIDVEFLPDKVTASGTVAAVVFSANIVDDYTCMNLVKHRVANPEDISVEIEETLKKAYEKLASYASRAAEIVMTGT